MTRRGLLYAAGSAPLAASAAGTKGAQGRDFLKELGVRPIINGSGAYTMTLLSKTGQGCAEVC